ncbi:MAG: hypothetical protein M1477_00290 [Candidatus Thermoplasmatota archaeon]|jgi:hypothetical protein|nr:hypothetical protein [Candidatus Thermoplasmatota archaeon]MCL5988812.1 hypothetical protein [Candidatus Thermoplasmatota archaeon]MCL5990107.1 hypothetical protein [Candidatus Thermoplasmatota archaeon]
MAGKLLVIISSGEEAREKAVTGLRFAVLSKKFKWMDEVEVVLFGPSEKLATKDEEFKGLIKEGSDIGIVPIACSNIAQKDNITESLKHLGFSVDPIGPVITGFMNKGFVPMTF